MNVRSLEQELKTNAYPGRGIVIGETGDGRYAVTAYFIMGRSANSRNRVFVTEGEGIRTQAFDPEKLEDPSLIIYAPVRVLGNKTIAVIRRIPFMREWIISLPLSSLCAAVSLSRMLPTIRPGFPVSFTRKMAVTAMPCLF